MGPLLKDITEVQHIQDVAATAAQPQSATPAVAQLAQPDTTPVQPDTTQTGIPRGMTSIAPASQVVAPSTDIDEPTELGRIRKNAGITV
jgi:hypothetical protein